MFSSAPMRPRSALLIFGIGLGPSGLLSELPWPKPAGLPFDRNGTEAAAARRTRAVLAAEIGEMPYFTAPSALDLAPWRLERAATSSALADKELQAFIKSNIRGIGQQR